MENHSSSPFPSLNFHMAYHHYPSSSYSSAHLLYLCWTDIAEPAQNKVNTTSTSAGKSPGRPRPPSRSITTSPPAPEPCIIHSCGFDSIPSDMTLYVAHPTLVDMYPGRKIASR